MRKYINALGRIITASSKAYDLFYKEQGYLPFKDEVAKPKDHIQEIQACNEETATEDIQYSHEYLATLEYAEIKEIGKQLEIPKYANTKKDNLIELILEKQSNGDDDHDGKGTTV